MLPPEATGCELHISRELLCRPLGYDAPLNRHLVMQVLISHIFSSPKMLPIAHTSVILMLFNFLLTKLHRLLISLLGFLTTNLPLITYILSAWKRLDY